MDSSRHPPRSAEPSPQGPETRFEPERFYREAPYPYRKEYAPMLKYHRDPDTALAELALFHFWFTQCVYRQCRRAASPHDLSSVEAVALLPPSGWRLPDRVEGMVVEQVLSGPLALLLENRSDLYQRFFELGRHAQDPQGLAAVSLALACQLFEDPSPAVRAWLLAKVERLFAEISRSCADGGDPGPPSP